MQRRKNYFIKKKFQSNFTLKFIALILLESVLIAGLFMYSAGDSVTTGFQNSVLTVERTGSFFLTKIILISLIAVVGISLAGLIVFTLISHKIAGPLYRFEQVLKSVTEGDLTTKVTLRTNDQLEEVQNELNVLIGSLDKRLGHVKERLKKIDSLLQSGHDTNVLSQINKELQSIREEINHFKVSSDS